MPIKLVNMPMSKQLDQRDAMRHMRGIGMPLSRIHSVVIAQPIHVLLMVDKLKDKCKSSPSEAGA